MSRTDEIDKIVDEIGDADSLYEFAEGIYEDRQRIAELEEQLDKKEKEIRQLDNEKGMLLNNSMKLLKEKDDRLKSQPAEIVEKIKEQLIKRLNIIAGYGRMTTDEFSFFVENEFTKDIDTILKSLTRSKI